MEGIEGRDVDFNQEDELPNNAAREEQHHDSSDDFGEENRSLLLLSHPSCIESNGSDLEGEGTMDVVIDESGYSTTPEVEIKGGEEDNVERELLNLRFGNQVLFRFERTSIALNYRSENCPRHVFTLPASQLQIGCRGSTPNSFLCVRSIDNSVVAQITAQGRLTWLIGSDLEISIQIYDIMGRLHLEECGNDDVIITLCLRRPPRLYKRASSSSGALDELKRVCGEDFFTTSDSSNNTTNDSSSSNKHNNNSGENSSTIFGDCLIYRLRTSINDNFREFLQELIEVHTPDGETLVVPVFSDPLVLGVVKADDGFKDISEKTIYFEVLFKLHALISKSILPNPAIAASDSTWTPFLELISATNKERAVNALDTILAQDSLVYERDLTETLQREIDRAGDSQYLGDLTMVPVYHAVITPTKIWFFGPRLEESNRVLRHFANHIDRFLCVTFSNEDFKRLEVSPSLVSRVDRFVKNGYDLCGRHYEFLGFSKQLLQNHSCWFFAPLPDLSCDTILSWIGKCDDKKSVGEYAYTMGLSLSSSIATTKVDYQMISEIRSDDGNKVLSSGSGKMSVFEALRLQQKIGSRRSSSAYKIRIGGMKGVVAMWRDSQHKLELRPSMLKFTCSHNDLEVVEVARYSPAYLNRHTISLMNHYGVPDQAFINLQNYMLVQLDNMLKYEGVAVHMLERYAGNKYAARALKSGFTVQEPYLEGVLKSYTSHHLWKLRFRSKIFFEGCRLMGILDETRTLQYGQVFVQITDPAALKTRIITGDVVIVNTSSLHPGSMRVAQAVDIPALHEQIDVIVFPAQGPQQYVELVASRLGDSFLVSWDKTFIPKRSYVLPPTDHSDVKEAPKNDVHQFGTEVEEVKRELIASFFVDYIQNDCISAVSKAHMAIADQACPDDPRCIELANLLAVALDFCKTGVPAKIDSSLLPTKYPDFMGKPDDISYQSPKVLGQLYRTMQGVPTSAPSVYTLPIKLDRSLKVDGLEDYIHDAQTNLHDYECSLKSIMYHAGIKHEAQLNNITPKGRQKRAIRQDTRKAFYLLTSKFRNKFNESFVDANGLTVARGDTSVENAQHAKASAWYYVTYRRYTEDPPTTKNEDVFLTFAWIMGDVLCRIKKYHR